MFYDKNQQVINLIRTGKYLYILADQVKTLKPCDEDRRRKWKVVYMYGTVALRSPIPTF